MTGKAGLPSLTLSTEASWGLLLRVSPPSPPAGGSGSPSNKNLGPSADMHRMLSHYAEALWEQWRVMLMPSCGSPALMCAAMLPVEHLAAARRVEGHVEDVQLTRRGVRRLLPLLCLLLLLRMAGGQTPPGGLHGCAMHLTAELRGCASAASEVCAVRGRTRLRWPVCSAALHCGEARHCGWAPTAGHYATQRLSRSSCMPLRTFCSAGAAEAQSTWLHERAPAAEQDHKLGASAPSSWAWDSLGSAVKVLNYCEF